MQVKKIFTILMLLSIFACNQHRKYNINSIDASKLHGTWQMVKFTSNQKLTKNTNTLITYKFLINSTKLEFLPNNKIRTYILDAYTEGNWQLSGNKLIVYNQKGKEKFWMKILKLTDTDLILYREAGKVKLALYFKKLK